MIFSDEKRFCLDDLDGLACYWHNLKTEPIRFSTHQQGGGLLMVSGAVSFYNQSELYFVNVNLNLEQYCAILEALFLPMAAEIFE